jgi:hypothetical protein
MDLANSTIIPLPREPSSSKTLSKKKREPVCPRPPIVVVGVVVGAKPRTPGEKREKRGQREHRRNRRASEEPSNARETPLCRKDAAGEDIREGPSCRCDVFGEDARAPSLMLWLELRWIELRWIDARWREENLSYVERSTSQ